MVKCGECGKEVLGYYEENDRKLCIDCYSKLGLFSLKKETVLEETKIISENVEKWIVIKNGNETVWTHHKVETGIRNGKQYMKIGYGFGFLLIIIWIIWGIFFTKYVSFVDTIIRGLLNPIVWIAVVLIVMGKYGATIFEDATQAKDVYDVKK